MFIVVTRHQGTLQWIKSALHEPVKLIAELNQQGIRYLHSSVEIPAHWRGLELASVQLDELGARLEEFHVECMSGDFKPIISTSQYEGQQ